MVSKLPLIRSEADGCTTCLGLPEDVLMKHPVRSDFDTAVTEAGVTVTFKPTNSIYSFYRLAESEDVARLGPVSPGGVRHAGPGGDTEDYPSDEVQDMALLMKFKTWRSGLLPKSPRPFGPFKTRKQPTN